MHYSILSFRENSFVVNSILALLDIGYSLLNIQYPKDVTTKYQEDQGAGKI